jgi:hypothetical protein
MKNLRDSEPSTHSAECWVKNDKGRKARNDRGLFPNARDVQSVSHLSELRQERQDRRYGGFVSKSTKTEEQGPEG